MTNFLNHWLFHVLGGAAAGAGSVWYYYHRVAVKKAIAAVKVDIKGA